jgi:hypothetical protein
MKKQKLIYHTAIKSKNTTDVFIENGFTGNLYTDQVTVLLHNIENGYLKEFDKCDVLYSNPAWKAGYEIFMNKANQALSDFNTYVKAICDFIDKSGSPAILIIGKADSKIYEKYLLDKDQIKFINIYWETHNAEAYVLAYKFGRLDFKTDIDIKQYISDTYNCVGDFCCGYGDVTNYFYKKGKSFVVSDINENCLAYIIDKFKQ